MGGRTMDLFIGIMIAFTVLVVIVDSIEAWAVLVHPETVLTVFWMIAVSILAFGVNLWHRPGKHQMSR
jgi:hypothetical protein